MDAYGPMDGSYTEPSVVDVGLRQPLLDLDVILKRTCCTSRISPANCQGMLV
jgi:hypothetical protein